MLRFCENWFRRNQDLLFIIDRSLLLRTWNGSIYFLELLLFLIRKSGIAFHLLLNYIIYVFAMWGEVFERAVLLTWTNLTSKYNNRYSVYERLPGRVTWNPWGADEHYKSLVKRKKIQLIWIWFEKYFLQYDYVMAQIKMCLIQRHNNVRP